MSLNDDAKRLNVPPSRVAPVKSAAAGCWEGTEELIATLVEESRHKGAWKPARAALISMMAGPGERHMTPDQFRIWKKQARALVKITGRTERPIDDLGMEPKRFAELGNADRCRDKGIYMSRSEALACAHYLAGFDKPCTPEGLGEWFYPRFGTFAGVSQVLNLNARSIAERINGYRIEKGVRKIIVPEGHFIRALDWIWRFGILNPYGDRPPVAFWPEQDLIER